MPAPSCSTCPPSCAPRSPTKPAVLHLQGVGGRPAPCALLLDVLLAGRGRRAPGHREAHPRRGGVQLDERPPGGRGTRSRWPGRPASSASPRATATLVAFSAGSGITPVYSLIKTALATTARRVRLVYANRDRDSHHLPLRDRQPLGASTATASRCPTISTPTTGSSDPTRSVGSPMLPTAAGTPTSTSAAPAPFMEVVEGTLLASGVDAGTDPHRALHPGPRPPSPRWWTGPAAPERVTIELDGRTEDDRAPPRDDDPADGTADGDVPAVLLRSRGAAPPAWPS